MMMNEIKNILVPIDPSKNNENFLETVAAIAIRHSAKVHFLNVVKASLLGTGNALSGKFYYHGNALIANSENFLDQQKKSFEESYGITVETYTATGSVPNIVVEFASAKAMDLIAIGVDYPKKRPGFISSNSYEIVTESTVPVITVPFTHKKSDFSKVLYPVRDTEGVISKLQPLLPIAKKNKSRIKLLGITSANAESSIITVNNALKFLRVKLAKQNLKFDVNEVCIAAKPEDEIIKQSENSKASLLAINVTTDKPLTKLFQNNFTENIIYKSKIPVLFYKKEKETTPLEQYVAMPYPMMPV